VVAKLQASISINITTSLGQQFKNPLDHINSVGLVIINSEMKI